MERALFLNRVTAALRSEPAGERPPLPDLAGLPWNGPTDREAMIERFGARLTEIGGTVVLAATRTAARAGVAEMLEVTQRTAIVCPPSLRWQAIEGAWIGDPAAAEFGLSEADYGIAETGTVVLVHRGENGRSHSLVPPAVGFLLPVSRLVPRLGAVLAAVHGDSDLPPACITFVSGLSHSGDIAGITCNGVHGPGEVRVWLIADE